MSDKHEHSHPHTHTHQSHKAIIKRLKRADGHLRSIIVMIEEIHGRPTRAGDSFSAAHIVGYFDSIEEMHRVYDKHKGHTRLEVHASGWQLGR